MVFWGPEHDISMRNVDELTPQEWAIGNTTNEPVLKVYLLASFDLSMIQFLVSKGG